MTRSSIARTVLALVRPVVGSMVLSVAGIAIARLIIPFHVLEESNDVVGNYLQTLGSIEDLDSCYEGHWQVSQLPFQRVLDQMTTATETPSSVSASRREALPIASRPS